MLETHTLNVVRTLRPAKRALGLTGLARWTQRGLGAGAGLALLTLVTAHVWPSHFTLQLCLALLTAGAAVGALGGVLRWPGWREAARAADRRFALQDRLTTAHELRFSDTAFSRLQRADAVRHVDGLDLRRSRQGRLSPREFGATAGVIAVFAAVLLLGGVPVSSSAATRAPLGDELRIRAAALVGLPAIIRREDTGLTPEQRRDPAIRQLNDQLASLRHQLLRAQTRRTALRAISLTQAQLRQIAASLHPVDPASAVHLNQSLAQTYPQHQSQPRSKTKDDATAAAHGLNDLANRLSHLNPAQRNKLSRTLAEAASAVGDGQLREQLSRAAFALANNDPQLARSYLRQAARLLARSPDARIARDRLNDASNRLDQLKNNISGVRTGRRFGTGRGVNRGGSSNGSQSARRGDQPGQTRSGAGVHRVPRIIADGRSAIQRRANERATSLTTGSSKESASAQLLTAYRTRQAGKGGVVAGDISAAAAEKGKGGFIVVYVPGIEGTGPHTLQPGLNGAPKHAVLIPYRQIIVQYAHSAQVALNRAVLPPSLQSYVRQYFVLISQ